MAKSGQYFAAIREWALGPGHGGRRAMICGRSRRAAADPLALQATLIGALAAKGSPVFLAPFTPTSGDTEIWPNMTNR